MDMTVIERRAKAIRNQVKIPVVIAGETYYGEPMIVSSDRRLALYGSSVNVSGSVRLIVSEIGAIPAEGRHITVNGVLGRVVGTEIDALGTTVRIDYEVR